MDDKLLFTVGETAKLHGLNAKTLRYYDEIGLFSPAETGANGYRYYSVSQFETLNTIRFLRAHGFPIGSIREHLRLKDAEAFIEKLKDRRSIYEAELRRIRRAAATLNERINELEAIREKGASEEIEVVWKPPRRITVLKKRITSLRELEMDLLKLETTAGDDPLIMIGRVGLTIAKDDLLAGRYDTYSSIFLLQDDGIQPSEILKQGNYLRIFVNDGSHGRSAEIYAKLLNYADANNLEISGDAVERVIIDSFITSSESEHISEIELPVQSKKAKTVKPDSRPSDIV